MQPPWSIAMSTTTEPGRIASIMSSVTTLGAAAPGTSTEPITRSASVTLRSTASTVEYSVLSCAPKRMSSSSSRGIDLSSTVTLAS